MLDSETEADVRASVRDLLADRCAASAVARIYDGDRSVVEPLWKAVSTELGLAAILIPEHLGGAGGTARDAAIVLEELGRAVAPVPFLTSSVLATVTLLAAPPDDAAQQLLTELATGETVAALAIPFSTAHAGQVRAVSADATGRLVGRIASVAGALEADTLLVPVAGPSGTAIHWIRAQDVNLSPVPSLDMSRQLADVSLHGVASTPIADASQGHDVLDQALTIGSALLASEQVGVATWCFDTTVGYLKQRRQFGRLVGSFQALKHRLADQFVAIETARSAASYAAAVVAAGDPDTPVAAAVAQTWCGESAVRAAEVAIQLHGGVGMTWEYPAHLYLKRAKADQSALGSPSYHRHRLAELVDLPGPTA